MQLGTGIFLSAAMLSIVILFVATKDRWNWAKGLRRLAVLCLILICSFGIWYGYESYKEKKIHDEIRRAKQEQQLINSECQKDKVCNDLKDELNQITEKINKNAGLDALLNLSDSDLDNLQKITLQPVYSSLKEQNNFSGINVKVTNKSGENIYKLYTISRIVEKGRPKPWIEKGEQFTFDGGLLPGESRLIKSNLTTPLDYHSFLSSGSNIPKHVSDNIGRTVSITFTPIKLDNRPSHNTSIIRKTDRDKFWTRIIDNYSRSVEVRDIKENMDQLVERQAYLKDEYAKKVEAIKSQFNLN